MLLGVHGWRGLAARPRSLTGKLAASVVTITGGAAVAGVGTFGTFTDPATPLGTGTGSGNVSIDLDGDRLGAFFLAFGGLLPGGSATRTVTLTNDGDTDLASVVLAAVARISSVLDTDRVHGLQLTVRSCSVAWTSDDDCAGEQRTVLEPGPVIRAAALDDPASLLPGGTDHLALTVSLPASAGNEFAGRSSALEFTFTAVQRTGAAR
jgi:hypothetical protein